MSGFTKLAVAGAGNVGQSIAKELIAQQPTASVVVLSRTADKALPGASTIVVDYTSSRSLRSALKGIDVVICTLGLSPTQPAYSRGLADAAKAEGVQLFVPAEFGNPKTTKQGGPTEWKKEFQDYLQGIGLPSLLVYTGPFPAFCLSTSFGFDWKAAKVTIVGKGDTPVGFTEIPDVGYYTAKALLTLPKDELQWGTIRTESFRLSFNEIVKLYEKLHPGEKVEITCVPLEEAKETVKNAKPGDLKALVTHLKVDWDQGLTPYNDGPLVDDSWSDEHRKVTAEEVIGAL